VSSPEGVGAKRLNGSIPCEAGAHDWKWDVAVSTINAAMALGEDDTLAEALLPGFGEYTSQGFIDWMS
jgi:hypothetical protein